jgi:hypothetical protein
MPPLYPRKAWPGNPIPRIGNRWEGRRSREGHDTSFALSSSKLAQTQFWRL